MTNLRQDVDFDTLFKKLGHSLEEIRVRALNNILSKLEHKLICEADLVHERHLLIRLLEWFNFKPCPMEAQVLDLLLRLVKHDGSSEILLAVGGLEFLAKLRQSCDVSLQSLIDQLMECLMRIPDSNQQQQQHRTDCLYQGGSHQGEITALVNSNLDSTTGSSSYPHSTQPGPSSQSGQRPVIMSTDWTCQTDPQSGQIQGYFTLTQHRDDTAPRGDSHTALSQCFKMTTFPWLALTPTDRHVLSSTNSSLQSGDASLLASACEFLSDVVFQDFPPEVFLQRPAIVQSLLSLLREFPDEFADVPAHTAQTLADLASGLRARMNFYQDPSFYTPKQDFTSVGASTLSSSRDSSSQSVHSLDSRPPVIGHGGTRHRGDGRDQDSSTNGNLSSRSVSRSSLGEDVEEVDYEDIQSLQFLQMTLAQFSILTLEKCLPLLRLTSGTLLNRLLHLISEITDLLGESLTADIWQDNTVAGREIADKLEECFEMFGELLDFHHHDNRSHGIQSQNSSRKKEASQHRVVYLGISSCLVQLLKTILPVEQSTSVLSEGLMGALKELVYDESVGQSYPELRNTVLRYMQTLSPDTYSLYQDTVDVCRSMEDTCHFLINFDTQNQTNLEEQLGLGMKCLHSLPYHRHGNVVTQLVQLSSLLCLKERSTRYQSVLLQLLSYPLVEIRATAYKTCHDIIKKNLNVDEAANPQSTASNNVRFLLDTQILQEIIYFGLSDKKQKVNDVATQIMTHLLQSQLLMTEDMWGLLLSSLLPVLPVLQGYTQIQSSLGGCLINLTEPEPRGEAGRLPLLERLRCTLRLMLSTDTKCRAECLSHLAWFLSHEEGSTDKLPTFTDLDVTNITNLFIVQSQRVVDEEDMEHSTFKVDGLRKVYDIFASSSVEAGVRKSALDQLSIILQDAALHKAFTTEGGLDKVVEAFHRGVCKSDVGMTENFTAYIPACLTILRHLVHHSSSLRHQLAHDSPIYYTILRGALLYHQDENVCYEASHLLTLLLFDEVAKFQLRKSSSETSLAQHNAFSLPAVVCHRYRLPFKTAVHFETSPHQVPLPPDSDPLSVGMPAEMLRVTWNVAWHSGMEKLLTSLNYTSKYNKASQEFSSHLRLSTTDMIVLESTYIQYSLQQSLYCISNATSHTDVKAALWTLSCHFSTRGHRVKDIFHQLNWQTVLGRFLQTSPSSSADETLLLDILQFITLILKVSNHKPEHIIQWLGETLYHPSGPLIGLLNRSHASGESENASFLNIRRHLDKQLLSFIAVYNSKLPYSLCERLSIGELRGNLSHKLLLRLNVADAPHFYNLASLEGTLQCLMHITARPGWSEECTEIDSGTLCSQLLNSLLEVVSAFHIGRGGTSMSYMGKGVTKAATLCLRQLAYEMAILTEDKDWPKNWLYSRQGTDAMAEPGLNWMLTLWAYRDSEVRASGLGIAVALTSTEPGRIMITTNCKHIPGGIWGAAVNILLDQSECSIVRQQAALLLINLTSQTMPSSSSGETTSQQTIWQGPVLTDTQYQVALVGLPALLALLRHSQFYEEVVVLLLNFYPQPGIHPVSIAEGSPMSRASSQATFTTADSLPVNRSTLTASESLANSSRPLLSPTPDLSNLSQRPGGRLTSSFGVRAGGENSITTTTTPGSGESTGEYQSVASPCLVFAVCQLIRNLLILAPQETLAVLKQHSILQTLLGLIDAELLETYCMELAYDNRPLQYELVFSDLLHMSSAILKLLRTCLNSDPTLCNNVLGKENRLKAIGRLLGLPVKGQADTQRLCREVWRVTYTVFISLQLTSQPSLQLITMTIIREQWQVIMSNVQRVLEGKGSGDKELYLCCLSFLAVLLSAEGKPAQKNADQVPSWGALLDHTGTPDLPVQPTGSKLCKALMTTYESNILSPADTVDSKQKLLVLNALKCLLGRSQSATCTALDAGLVERLIAHLKQLNVKLNRDSLQIGRQTNKKKEESIISDIVQTMDVLRNFMFQNLDVKRAAYHSDLGNILHRLWSWCQVSPALMASVLAILTTYTAKCPQAASSLACTSMVSVSISPPGPSKGQLSSNSLVHCLIKQAQHELVKESQHQAIFGLLATLVLSTECRNILWKSNFLHEFSQLEPKRTKKPKAKLGLELLWLDVLVNLSFSSEGQQMICKVKDSVSLLLEFADGSHVRCREKSLLILRNLCFHAGNKPKLLSNDLVIPLILGAVSSDSITEKTVASSALWALVYNNQKAKVAMKNANVIAKVQNVLEIMNQKASQEPSHLKCVANLQNVLAAVSE